MPSWSIPACAAFTIGPGFVPTQTALSAIPQLASMMGIPLEELNVILKEQTISVEAAGAGFAAAVALADQFKGQETASVPALIAAGIEAPKDGRSFMITYTQDECARYWILCRKVPRCWPNKAPVGNSVRSSNNSG